VDGDSPNHSLNSSQLPFNALLVHSHHAPASFFTNQFWDFISILFYALVIMLTILAVIVDLLILWFVWEMIWYWLKRLFKKKGKIQ
jgi:hypothetical protein